MVGNDFHFRLMHALDQVDSLENTFTFLKQAFQGVLASLIPIEEISGLFLPRHEHSRLFTSNEVLKCIQNDEDKSFIANVSVFNCWKS